MNGFAIQFLHGLCMTVLVAAISGVLGTAVGLAGAASKLSAYRIPMWLAEVYTTVIRGVPELLVILLIYFGGTAAITFAIGRYVEISALSAGVIALTVIFGAYSTEIFRGAILSIPRGQWEAASSIGLKSWQIWLLVILPQMVRVALPAFCNLWISLLKDTALISVVGLTDIMRVAFVGAGSMRAPLPFYLAASALYLLLTSVSLLAFRRLEQHIAVPGQLR
jgi:octopine/nopaline transport system permease protein